MGILSRVKPSAIMGLSLEKRYIEFIVDLENLSTALHPNTLPPTKSRFQNSFIMKYFWNEFLYDIEVIFAACMRVYGYGNPFHLLAHAAEEIRTSNLTSMLVEKDRLGRTPSMLAKQRKEQVEALKDENSDEY